MITFRSGVSNLFNMQCQFVMSFSLMRSNNIVNIKLNYRYDTATKNISGRPGIVLFPYSPQSCINICSFFFKFTKNVKAMHTGHNIFYIFFSITHSIGLKTIHWSHFRTLLSVTHLNIFALGGNAQNRIKCKKNHY